MTTYTVRASSNAFPLPSRKTLTTMTYGNAPLKIAKIHVIGSATISQQASDSYSIRISVFELFLRSAKKLLHALTSPNKCALTLTTTRFWRRSMTARLMLIVLPKSPMCSALQKSPIATFCMLSTRMSTCPLFSQLTTILTLYDDHLRKHTTCSNPLPDFENTVLMLTRHSNTYGEHVTDVLRASPTSPRFLLRKLFTRFERESTPNCTFRLKTI